MKKKAILLAAVLTIVACKKDECLTPSQPANIYNQETATHSQNVTINDSIIFNEYFNTVDNFISLNTPITTKGRLNVSFELIAPQHQPTTVNIFGFVDGDREIIASKTGYFNTLTAASFSTEIKQDYQNIILNVDTEGTENGPAIMYNLNINF